jgi:hypothetical protein
MTESFDDIIKQLVVAGVQVTLRMHGGRMVYDLNTGMKSHLWVQYDDQLQVINCWGRYDHYAQVDSWSGLLTQVKRCMHGRDFANAAWLDLLVSEGMLTRTVTQVVSYQ